MDTGWIKLPLYEVTEDDYHMCQVCRKHTAMFKRTTNKLTGDYLTIYICSPFYNGLIVPAERSEI